jgi:hypothetical protein
MFVIGLKGAKKVNYLLLANDFDVPIINNLPLEKSIYLEKGLWVNGKNVDGIDYSNVYHPYSRYPFLLCETEFC